jgi:hypothetical protein
MPESIVASVRQVKVKRNSWKVDICCAPKNQTIIVFHDCQKQITIPLTGMKGGCILNEIPYFHVVSNYALDDLLEESLHLSCNSFCQS